MYSQTNKLIKYQERINIYLWLQVFIIYNSTENVNKK